MKHTFISMTIALLAVFMWPPAALSDIVVIANPKAGISTLDADAITKLFMSKVKSFPDGRPAVPVALKEGMAPRNEFDSGVLHKTPNQMKAYWSQLVFTGRGTPPQEYASEEEVRQLVAKNPNIVGYLSSDKVDASVRIVYTIK